MTEPKKEKCEACCGSGYINFWTDDGHISMRTCRRCNGYGYIKAKPMTNEEWFASLSTEEKAEWISKVTIDAWFRQVNNELPKPNGAKEWAEWLKQPHTPKE